MSGLRSVFKGFPTTLPFAPFHLAELAQGRTGSGPNWLRAELAVESAILPETSAVHFPAIDFVEA